jgi:glycerophosphoryl diester phosphodiesterase
LPAARSPLASLISLTNVAVIAHRGGSKLRPENTAAAFAHAVSLGVDALECDVHLSRDGEVIVIHDATLERTTNARGPVSALTADELSRVDASAKFAPPPGAPAERVEGGVPRLADLLARHSLPFVIEIKGDDVATAERAVAVLQESRALDRVVIGGFSHVVLETVRRLAPDLPTSASSLEARAAVRRALFRMAPKRTGFELFQVPYRLRGKRMFGRAFVAAAQRAGVPVQAWIVDDPDDMRRLVEWGVTGLISDRPDVAVDVARRHNALHG